MEQWRRAAKSYKRPKATRAPYETVLIVCEGSKTEPNYFRRCRTLFGLGSLEVEIASGTDPLTVARHAIERLSDDKYLNKAFCVFDRDSHANFNEAMQLITNSKYGREGRLAAIASHPCFELWVLLHFEYWDRPFARSGNRSICDNVVAAVQERFPEYNKGHQNIFDVLVGKLPNAIANGRRLDAHNTNTKTTNPGTQIHILVDYLRNLKNQKPDQ